MSMRCFYATVAMFSDSRVRCCGALANLRALQALRRLLDGGGDHCVRLQGSRPGAARSWSVVCGQHRQSAAEGREAAAEALGLIFLSCSPAETSALDRVCFQVWAVSADTWQDFRRRWRFSHKLLITDATLIALSISLFDSAQYRHSHEVVRPFVIPYREGRELQFGVLTTGRTVNLTVARRLRSKPNMLQVTVRSFMDYHWWMELIIQGLPPIAQLEDNAEQKLVEQWPADGYHYISRKTR